MPLEEPRLRREVRVEVAARKTGHDLEQNCDVIFRLTRRSSALNSQDIEIFTDARERPLVQEAREIIRGIGQQLASSQSDKQIEKFLGDSALVESHRNCGEFDVRHAEIGRVAFEHRDLGQRVSGGRLAQQQRQQAVLRGAKLIDFVDL